MAIVQNHCLTWCYGALRAGEFDLDAARILWNRARFHRIGVRADLRQALERRLWPHAADECEASRGK